MSVVSAAQPRRTGAPALALTIALAGTFMVYLDATIANVAFPAIHGSFPSVGESSLAWVLNGYNIAFAALPIPAGILLDRLVRSRERMLGDSLIAFSLASLLCALAASEPWLVAFRVLQGIAAGALIPAALSVLLAQASVQRLRAIAILAAAAGAAGALGPTAGGILVHYFGWRSIFLVNVPIGALAAAAAWQLPSGGDTEAEFSLALSMRVSACGTAAVGALTLMLSEAPRWGWTSAGAVAPGVAGVALLVYASLRGRADARRAGDDLLGTYATTANLATALISIAFLGKIINDVVFLTGVWRYSVLQAGLALTPSPVITALLAVPASRLGNRMSLRALGAIGGVLYAGGALWYATRVGAHADYVARWLPGTVLTGAGLAFSLPALTGAAMLPALPTQYGAGSAVNASARALGGAVGIAATTTIIANATGVAAFRQAWLLVLAAALASAIVIGWPRWGTLPVAATSLSETSREASAP